MKKRKLFLRTSLFFSFSPLVLSTSCFGNSIDEKELENKFDLAAKNIRFDVANKSEVFVKDIRSEDIFWYASSETENFQIDLISSSLKIVSESQLEFEYRLIDLASKYKSKKPYTARIEGFKKEEDPNLKVEKIRLSHWNICNFSHNSNEYKSNYREEFFANTINYLKVDIQGITELNDDSGAEKGMQNIAEKLNILNPKAHWKWIVKRSFNSEYESASEKIGFLYKSSVVTLKKFNSSTKREALSYDNSNYKIIKNENFPSGYVRPPLGAFFETRGQVKNDFTFVIGHHDSPGVKKGKEQKGPRSQGAKEYDESKNVKNVLDYFDKLDGKNNELIYSGDTNIRLGNESKFFDTTISSGYNSLIKDTKANASSIGAGESNPYVHPYDKIFYKGDLQTKNSKVYKLLDVFNDGVIKGYSSIYKWYAFHKDKLRKNDGGEYSEAFTMFKAVLSDHCPVYTDLVLNANDAN